MIDFIIKNEKKIFAVLVIFLITLTLLTSYYGSTDIGDYSDVAKFFSGEYSAKIRSSHSYLLGFLHSPFVGLFNSLIIFKITSLLFLGLIVYSVYVISGRSRKALWLSFLSPVIWYMAPWINPIQIASLLLLWAFYHMQKYDQELRIKNLFYSGLLIGLGLAFWDTILYFGVILAVCFLYNRKVSHFALFFVSAIIGLIPRMILDQYLFNFAFFTTIKTFVSGLVNLSGGIYDKGYGHSPKTILGVLSFLLAMPLYSWILCKFNIFKENKKSVMFLILSLLLLIMNPQIRYLLALSPIIVLLIFKHLSFNNIKIYLFSSALIIMIFITPYILQINYSLNEQIYGIEATSFIREGIDISEKNIEKDFVSNLKNIINEHPNEVFVIGNEPDSYQIFAHFYWEDNVKDFVSIQDYQLWEKNESVLYKKKFEPIPNIPERRQFWIEGGLKKNEVDSTNYEEIEYAISFREPLRLDGFIFEKKFGNLELFKKV